MTLIWVFALTCCALYAFVACQNYNAAETTGPLFAALIIMSFAALAWRSR